MSQAVSSAHRALAWNIIFVTLPPHNDWRAGTYQPMPSSQLHNPQFLTWRMLFNDTAMCFDIRPYLDLIVPTTPSAQDKDIGLWVRKELSGTSLRDESSLLPCIYMNSGGQILDRLISFSTLSPGSTTAEDIRDDGDATLYLSLVFHDHRKCSDTGQTNISTHMENGCLLGINPILNPTFKFIPIPSSASRPLQKPTSCSPALRPSTTPLSRSSQTGSNKQPYSASASAAPSPSWSTSSVRQTPQRVSTPDLVKDVRVLYKGTCVITGQNTSWEPGSTVCGPGIEVAHIIPKSMYQFYPNAASGDDGWNLINSPRNCILLDSLTHVIHDNRLIAIQPSSNRIRLFAPVKPLLEKSNRQAGFGRSRPAWESLDWHYNMCVVENMCAILLQEEGGAKRALRRWLPVSEIDEGTGDGSRKGIWGSEDNDDTREGGDGPPGATGPDASSSGPFTHGAATELHGLYKPSSSISISRHDSTTTTDATPSTPPELFSFEKSLQNPKYNAQADTMTSLQNKRPRLRIYTGSSATMPTEDGYCDSGEEENFVFYYEDEEETSKRRRRIEEELRRWINGEVNQAVNI
ncbi:MAG: hypothetical protein M1840_000969 [Geoglossum simile]|nr:MAG: hypothetical protein M1840_000969 [Geoglossum simile]